MLVVGCYLAVVKTLYLDIFSGISGDMFIGAMLDLGLDFKQFEREVAKLGLSGYHLHVSRQQRANIAGVKFDVHLDHNHDHAHEHEHTHADGITHTHLHSHDHDHAHAHEDDCSFGPHGGPLVKASRGKIELSVFETGVPPRFRIYFFDEQGKPAAPPPPATLTLETVRSGKS